MQRSVKTWHRWWSRLDSLIAGGVHPGWSQEPVLARCIEVSGRIPLPLLSMRTAIHLLVC